jgi:hypothetical protein
VSQREKKENDILFVMLIFIGMAKARKEGKPKKNRGNLVKNLNRIKKNQELLKNYEINL